jgi:hypothetical protein
MRCKLLLGLAISSTVAALVVPAVAAAVPAHHGPMRRISHSTSANWAGYAATGRTFKTVSATWKQPAGSCTSQTTYSSFWVGLDGDGSTTVEQTGTELDCVHGAPVYSAWYEMYPKAPVRLSLRIRAGDTIHASVTTDGRGSFTLTLKNVTTGRTSTNLAKLRHARLASAEVIVEAPYSGGVLPLTNFGTVGFSAARANGAAIGSFAPDRIKMVSGGVVKAVTSALSNGTSFSVTWKHV